MYKRIKGITLIELLLYLSLIAIIFASEICLIGFARAQKQKAEESIMISEIESLFMYSKEYSLANNCICQVIVDNPKNSIKVKSSKDMDKIREINLNKMKIYNANRYLYTVGNDGRIGEGGTICISSDESKKKFEFVIGVGTDNIRINEVK
ncbi:hypothetical protein SAMN02745163_02239 [Clostridium cavendishii DSM 21758]|uniref:Prepilin-type N-terminal cleavage/methylation domain-containing protein n=1 Tax=Clostridium cavendishii DSM 21758 TaxID=1121302 RepID=A0A1M6KM52_9CLOT|nr:prepilin-type N-terminal cleavage/methylation domain-containing protein [Clostridium cavendishii]SHJ60098.1 hypothetical protein SAMN02745163_02239 [Clostridium cavendishii DSM 21758]